MIKLCDQKLQQANHTVTAINILFIKEKFFGITTSLKSTQFNCKECLGI